MLAEEIYNKVKVVTDSVINDAKNNDFDWERDSSNVFSTVMKLIYGDGIFDRIFGKRLR